MTSCGSGITEVRAAAKRKRSNMNDFHLKMAEKGEKEQELDAPPLSDSFPLPLSLSHTLSRSLPPSLAGCISLSRSLPPSLADCISLSRSRAPSDWTKPSAMMPIITSNAPILEPYSRTMPRVLWWSKGGGGRFLMSEAPLQCSAIGCSGGCRVPLSRGIETNKPVWSRIRAWLWPLSGESD